MDLIRLFRRMRTGASSPEAQAGTQVIGRPPSKGRKTYRRPLKSVEAIDRAAGPLKSCIVTRHRPLDQNLDVARTLHSNKAVHFATYARVFPSGGVKKVIMPPPRMLKAPHNVAEVYARKLTYKQGQWVAHNMPELPWATDAACAHFKNARYPQA